MPGGRPHGSRECCRSGTPQSSQGPDRIGSTVGDRRWFRGFCERADHNFCSPICDVDIAVAVANDYPGRSHWFVGYLPSSTGSSHG